MVFTMHDNKRILKVQITRRIVRRENKIVRMIEKTEMAVEITQESRKQAK